MLKQISAFFVLLALVVAQPAFPATAPGDMVSVFSFTNTKECPVCFDEKLYQKKFQDIKLDAKTMSFLRQKTSELDKTHCPDKNPLCVYRLISLRIYDGDEVQRIIFGNKLGELFAWDNLGTECWISLTGNGMLGACNKQVGQ